MYVSKRILNICCSFFYVEHMFMNICSTYVQHMFKIRCNFSSIPVVKVAGLIVAGVAGVAVETGVEGLEGLVF